MFVCDALLTYIVSCEASEPPTVTASPDADIADPGDTSPPPQGGLGAHEQTAPLAVPPPRVEPTLPSPASEPTPPPSPLPPIAASPPEDPESPSSPTICQPRRARIPAGERWQRTLGPMRDSLRPRGTASQARGSNGSPSNRREAIADDEKGLPQAASKHCAALAPCYAPAFYGCPFPPVAAPAVAHAAAPVLPAAPPACPTPHHALVQFLLPLCTPPRSHAHL